MFESNGFIDGNQNYVCLRCGRVSTGEDLRLRGGDIKCIMCSYRVLVKEKPPVVQKVSSV
jgi:DNA-directed RNA polymerase subunit RPC12/RpoP